MCHEDKNMATQETTQDQTLYVVAACDAKQCEITMFYARDSEDARVKAHPWLAARPHLPEVTLDAFPNGYTLHTFTLPGHIPAEKQESAS